MAVLKNRAGVVTTTNGAGSITLGSAIPAGTAPYASAWQTFADAGVMNGDSVRYLVLDSNGAWEYGPGVVTGTTLARPATSMSGSVAGQKSSTGSLLSLSGDAQVFITAVAEDIPTPVVPGGSNTSIQYNDGGVLAGDAALIWDKTTRQFSVIDGDVNGRVAQFDADPTNTELTSAPTDHYNGLSVDVNGHKTSGATGYVTGLNLRAILNLDSGTTGSAVQGIHITTEANGSGTFGPGNQAFTIEAHYNVTTSGSGGYLSAAEVYANNTGTHAIPIVYGFVSQTWTASGSGLATDQIAGQFISLVEGSATTVRALDVISTLTGTVTTNYGLSVRSPSVGTLTNNYGIYIEDQSAAGSSVHKNLMSKGATSDNHFEGNILLDNYEEFTERSDPAAPASNKARLYSRDNGAGKTQLVVRFPTGAVQVLATEP